MLDFTSIKELAKTIKRPVSEMLALSHKVDTHGRLQPKSSRAWQLSCGFARILGSSRALRGIWNRRSAARRGILVTISYEAADFALSPRADESHVESRRLTRPALWF